MTSMKKVFGSKNSLLVVCFALMVGLFMTACGSKAPEANAPGTGKTAEVKTAKAAKDIKIGVVWEGKGSVADSTFEGFEKGMKKLAPEVNIELKKELKNVDELITQVKAWESEKDAVVIFRSNGNEWLGKNNLKIPAFFGACNHPDSLGIKDMATRKISGTSYYLPKKDQFLTFKMLVPKMETVALITGKTNASSNIDRSDTEAVCKELGLKYVDLAVSSPEDAVKAVEENKGKVSAFVVGTQAKIYDNIKNILTAAGTIPVFSYPASGVKGGALAGFTTDDVKLGTLLAENVNDTIIKGKSFADVSVQYDKTPKLMINETTAKKLDIKISEQLLTTAKVVR